MDHYVFAAVALVLILAGAALGSHVRASLADHHFSEDSLAAMRIAVGLVATLAALVLSLLISSGKSSLDLVNTALQHNGVAMIQLDRTLSQLGPPADGLRVDIKNDYSRWISFLFSNKTGTTAKAESREIRQNTLDIQGRIFALQTLGPWQEKLRGHAMELWDDIFSGRWLALEHRRGSIPTPLIAILIGWLAVIFGIFDFSAPRNWSMCVVFLLCAFSAKTAVYVVLDCPRSRHPISGNGQCVEDAHAGCAQVHRKMTMLVSCRFSIGLHISLAIPRGYVPRASGTRLWWHR